MSALSSRINASLQHEIGRIVYIGCFAGSTSLYITLSFSWSLKVAIPALILVTLWTFLYSFWRLNDIGVKSRWVLPYFISHFYFVLYLAAIIFFSPIERLRLGLFNTWLHLILITSYPIILSFKGGKQHRKDSLS